MDLFNYKLDEYGRKGHIIIFTKDSVQFSKRVFVATTAAYMLYNGESEREICTKEFNGRIYTNGEPCIHGPLFGMVYYAEVKTEEGLARITAVVCDQTKYDDITSRLN